MFVSPASRQQRRRAYSSLNLLDSITSSFNGSTTTFNLKLNGAAISPISASALEVVLGGVQQQPLSAYSVSGSTITFSSAPSSVDTCFIVWMQTTGLLASNPALAGGSTTQIQYNSIGSFAGDANLTWTTGASATLTVGNSTINTIVNSTIVSVGTISSTTVGVQATNSAIIIGNSSVNTTINSISFTETGATTNGCLYLPNGWLIQFGKVITTATGNVVTFPVAYVTNAYAITVTPSFMTSATIMRAHVNAVTKSGFTVFTGNTASLLAANAFWMTIGQ